MKGLMTARELGRYLSVSERKIYHLVAEGMPHIQIGNQYRFSLDDVLNYLKGMPEDETPRFELSPENADDKAKIED